MNNRKHLREIKRECERIAWPLGLSFEIQQAAASHIRITFSNGRDSRFMIAALSKSCVRAHLNRRREIRAVCASLTRQFA